MTVCLWVLATVLLRCLLELEGQGSIHDVGRGQAKMDVAARLTDPLAHGSKKRHDLMTNGLLDFLDPPDIKGSPGLDLLKSLARDLSELRPRLTGKDLDP
jgi:hypothetical protein